MSVHFNLSVGGRFLHTEPHSCLLCGLDFVRSAPSDEGGVIEINFLDDFPHTLGCLNSFISNNLPLLKGLLHSLAIRCEGSNGRIFVRPIPDDHDQVELVGFFHHQISSRQEVKSHLIGAGKGGK